MSLLNLSTLSLPSRIRDNKEVIFDPLRKKMVILTPEERVRQLFTMHLIQELGYPAGRIGNEIGIKLGNRALRCDTIIYDNFGKPLVIVEYKAPEVEITQEVFNQIVRYNMVLRVAYLFVYNGRNFYGCHINYETMQVSFLQEIPPYSAL